jgi:hypothetical protein
MRFEPRDGIVCLVGDAIAADPCPALKRVYKSLHDNEKLKRTEDTEKRLKHWAKLYQTAYLPKLPKKNEENA